MAVFLSILLLLSMCLFPFSPPILGVNALSLALEERQDGPGARDYIWPPHEWTPSTLANVMDRRIKQIEAIEVLHDRAQAYAVLVSTAGILGRNFTKYGWALTRAPPHLVETLTNELHKKPWANLEDESNLNPMGLRCLDSNPFMVDTTRVNRMILEELQDLHEQWVSCQANSRCSIWHESLPKSVATLDARGQSRDTRYLFHLAHWQFGRRTGMAIGSGRLRRQHGRSALDTR